MDKQYDNSRHSSHKGTAGGRPDQRGRPHKPGAILHSASPTAPSGQDHFKRRFSRPAGGGLQSAGPRTEARHSTPYHGRAGAGGGARRAGGRGAHAMRGGRRQTFSPRPMTSTFEEKNGEEKPVPPLAPGNIRIIP